MIVIASSASFGGIREAIRTARALEFEGETAKIYETCNAWGVSTYYVGSAYGSWEGMPACSREVTDWREVTL